MDLYHHTNPLFTQWIVDEGLLGSPFVIVDIGVQGGEHPRWQFLGTYADIYGFDAIAEVIEDLNGSNSNTGRRHYYNIALGDEDGERCFFVSANKFGSSFYSSDPAAEKRSVPIRRIDSLYREGLLPRADYIKLDCEGFEPEILKGARQYLTDSNVICVTTETNFNVSPIYPQGHFQAINNILVDHRLILFDENHVRAPAPAYAAAIAKQPWSPPDAMRDLPPLVVGRPSTYDVVFCRDLAAERREPAQFGPDKPAPEPTPADMVIKSMMNFELHGLMDCAVELAASFQELLAPRLNVEKAITLLLAPAPAPRPTADVTLCVSMIEELRARVRALEGHSIGRSPLARALSLLPQNSRRRLRKIIGERWTKAILNQLFGGTIDPERHNGR
jgi:FkbM family methyltransferase